MHESAQACLEISRFVTLLIIMATHYNVSLLFFAVLEKLIHRLDKRIAKQSSGGSFKCKDRVLSSLSSLQAPEDAPLWTLEQYHQPTPPATDLSTEATPPATDLDLDVDARLAMYC